CPVARPALIKDQRPARDLRELGTAAVLASVAATCSEQQRIFTKTDGLNFRMLQRARQPDFGLFVEQHLQNFFGVSRANGDEYAGMRALKPFQNIGQEINRYGECGRDL